LADLARTPFFLAPCTPARRVLKLRRKGNQNKNEADRRPGSEREDPKAMGRYDGVRNRHWRAH